jgi:hypothetical protein
LMRARSMVRRDGHAVCQDWGCAHRALGGRPAAGRTCVQAPPCARAARAARRTGICMHRHSQRPRPPLRGLPAPAHRSKSRTNASSPTPRHVTRSACSVAGDCDTYAVSCHYHPGLQRSGMCACLVSVAGPSKAHLLDHLDYHDVVKVAQTLAAVVEKLGEGVGDGPACAVAHVGVSRTGRLCARAGRQTAELVAHDAGAHDAASDDGDDARAHKANVDDEALRQAVGQERQHRPVCQHHARYSQPLKQDLGRARTLACVGAAQLLTRGPRGSEPA